MSTNAIFFGWNRPVPGRERYSAEQFQDFLQYLGGLQQAGTIESFEAVLLTPHGGDLNGFFLIRGEGGKLDKLESSEDWATFATRAGVNLEGAGFVRGATGELVAEWMNRWGRVISA